MFEKGERVDLKLIRETVKNAGFDLKRLELAVAGELGEVVRPEGEKVLAVRIESTGQRVLLVPSGSEESRKNLVEIRRWLRDAPVRLRVRGRAHTHPDGTIALEVSSFEVLHGSTTDAGSRENG